MKELKFMENQQISESTALHIGYLILKFKRIAKFLSILIIAYLPILVFIFNKVDVIVKIGVIGFFLCLLIAWFHFKRKSNLLTLNFNLQCWVLEMFETPYKMNHYIHKNNIKSN